MKDIKSILLHWATYYKTRRQVGHTYAAKNGTNNTLQSKLVVHRIPDGNILREKFYKYNNLEGMRGLSVPMVWDNAALEIVFAEAYTKILKQEEIIAELRQIAELYKNHLKESINKAFSESFSNLRDVELAIEKSDK